MLAALPEFRSINCATGAIIREAYLCGDMEYVFFSFARGYPFEYESDFATCRGNILRI
jgi:hypothetical protein